MGHIVQLAKQPGAVWREQVAAGLIAKLVRFLLYFVETMVEAAKLARRQPPVLIDPWAVATDASTAEIAPPIKRRALQDEDRFCFCICEPLI